MTTRLDFHKMEGIGNDFIVSHLSGSPEASTLFRPDRIIALCDRRRGIGADGIIRIFPSTTADYRVVIFNSDGSEAEMCGNGIRCCALYIRKLGLPAKNPLRFETKAGTIAVETLQEDRFRVMMGRPLLDAPLIPTTQPSGPIIMHELTVEGKLFRITAVSMGNPHAVIYADDLTDDLVLGAGPAIERHPFFPNRTNVEFVKVLSPSEIRMRVWERGCGETLACGTGACAAAVSGIINRLNGSAVTVHLSGGDLFVEWGGAPADPVFLTGLAAITFQGSIEIDG